MGQMTHLVVPVIAANNGEYRMKKIQIYNKFTESVTCLPGGSIIICMKTENTFELFLTKINRFVNTLEDGVEKIDECQPDISCRFGFVADRSERAITFNGDVTQVLKFCKKYALLTEQDNQNILETMKSDQAVTAKWNFFQWLFKKRNNTPPDENSNKITFKND